jgi:hypothetical protein
MRVDVVWTGLFAVLVGCGVSEDKTVTELSEGQIERVCTDLAKSEPVSLTCGGDELVYSPPSVEDCTRDLTDLPGACIATVGDLYACADGWAEVSCDSQLPEACAVYADASCQPELPPEEQ